MSIRNVSGTSQPAAYGCLERSRVGPRSVIACEQQPGQAGEIGRPLQPWCGSKGRPLFCYDLMPLRLRQGKSLGELFVNALRQFALRKPLVVA